MYFLLLQCYYFICILLKTPEQGADPVVYTALSQELHGFGGKMISNCLIHPTNPQAEDSAIQLKTWEMSCNVTKLKKITKSNSIVPDPFILIDVE